MTSGARRRRLPQCIARVVPSCAWSWRSSSRPRGCRVGARLHAKPRRSATSSSSPALQRSPENRFLSSSAFMVSAIGRSCSLRTFASEMPARVRMILPRAPTAYGDGFSWFEVLGTDRGRRLESRFRRRHHRRRASAGGTHREADERSRIRLRRRSCSATRRAESWPTTSRPSIRPRSSAALPIAGLLPPSLASDRRSGAKTFAYHGGRDDLVPIDAARATVAAFRAAGGQAELREYPHLGHAMSLAMVRDVQTRIVELLPASVR